MKKIYLTPDMEVVKMQTMTVLAGSPDAGEKYSEKDPVLSSGLFESNESGSEDW